MAKNNRITITITLPKSIPLIASKSFTTLPDGSHVYELSITPGDIRKQCGGYAMLAGHVAYALQDITPNNLFTDR